MRSVLSIAMLACAVLLLGPPGFAGAAAADTSGYEKAIATIRCDCGCHPQSVKDCACGRAAEMREEIRALVLGELGTPPLTGDQVIAKYVAEKGEQIRISPAASGFNLVAWLGPLIGLAGASLGMFVLLRRWRTPRETAEPTVAAAALDPQDPYLGRLERQLKEMQ